MTVTSIPGGAQAYSLASGGKIYAFELAQVLVEVAPANSSRRRLVFHNPGTIRIFVGPVNKVEDGSDADNDFDTAALAGSFVVYADGGTLTIEGECQGAWHALAESGVDNPLTVMDSNI